MGIMDFTKLSIKHFIGDVPNIINTNFGKVKNFVEMIFDASTGTLKSTNAEFTGKVKSNSVVTNNIIVNDERGKQITFAELIERVEKLEQALNAKNASTTSNGVVSSSSRKRTSK